MQQEPVLMLSPSFSSYCSIRFVETADRVCQEFNNERQDFGFESKQETISISISAVQNQGSKHHQERDEEFEFTFVCIEHETVNISADEIFSLGQIRPIFPVFSKDVILSPPPRSQEWNPSSLPKCEKVGTSYSVCSQRKEISAQKCLKKCDVTGTWKKWRLRDLFRKGSKKVEKVDKKTVNEASKMKKSDDNMKGTANLTQKKKGVSCQVVKVNQRRTFLPYQRDMLGIFAR